MINGLPSIPAYFKEHVDVTIDLEKTPSIPCPFHDEKSGKSFSYSRNLNIWRCFGACHCGGDVVDLHKLNMRIKSRKEAEKSICKIYGLNYNEIPDFSSKKEVEVNPHDVRKRRAYACAVRLAKTPDDWIELDYILSKVPYDVKELEVFCSVRGVLLEEV